MDTFLVAFETVLPLFLVIIAGGLFSRIRKSSEQWIDILNKYALWIGFPALVIASLMELDIEGKSYFTLIVVNSAYVVASMFLAFPLARVFGFSNKMKRTLFLILPFGNVAYLGIPVLGNAYGKEVLPVAAIISAVYVFWLLTLAIILIEIYDHKKIKPKNLLLSLVKNPLLISVFIGLAIVLFDIQLPEFAEKTIYLFSDSVTAVVLFSLGIFLGIHHFGNIQKWIRVSAWAMVSMLLLPAVFYFVLQFINMEAGQFKASLLDSVMPLGLTPYALSIQYKLETTLVARIVVFGTMFSMIVIPVVIAILG